MRSRSRPRDRETEAVSNFLDVVLLCGLLGITEMAALFVQERGVGLDPHPKSFLSVMSKTPAER